jgi:hypothetical protein
MYLVNNQPNKATENGYVLELLAHVEEPTDMYDIYLYSGEVPRDALSNARNIFDDSNIEDRKWFGAAKQYLSKAR